MKRYHHNPDQQRNLQSDCQEIIVRILQIDFDDPKVDDAMIRHHAHLRGKLVVLQGLLADDYADPHSIPDDSNFSEH